jgi:hypothetical protein
MDKALFYDARIQRFSQELSTVKKHITTISNARLAVALAFVIVTYYTFSLPSLAIVAGILLLLFIVLVRKHDQLFEKKVHLENLVQINTDEREASRGNTTAFYAGKEFINPHHPYTHDLDIFGEGSLFQYLNRCNTISGRKELAQRLSGPLKDAEQITSHQAAIRELADLPDFCQHFQAAGKEMKEKETYRKE